MSITCGPPLRQLSRLSVATDVPPLLKKKEADWITPEVRSLSNAWLHIYGTYPTLTTFAIQLLWLSTIDSGDSPRWQLTKPEMPGGVLEQWKQKQKPRYPSS